MAKLQFKTFTWPVNPETYREEFVREPVYVKTEAGTEFSGMGPAKRKITGSGAFFGTEAMTQYRVLEALFSDEKPGTLTHPELGARTVYFTSLTMTQNPKSLYVSYSFVFTEADADGEIPQ